MTSLEFAPWGVPHCADRARVANSPECAYFAHKRGRKSEVCTLSHMTMHRADRLLRLGATLVAVGMLATLIAIVPLVTGGHLTPLLWPLAMLTGVGLVLELLGVRAAAKARTQRVAELKES